MARFKVPAGTPRSAARLGGAPNVTVRWRTFRPQRDDVQLLGPKRDHARARQVHPRLSLASVLIVELRQRLPETARAQRISRHGIGSPCARR
jgi:hypothetical protein